jgi:N-acetylglucosamine-6-sulfatase
MLLLLGALSVALLGGGCSDEAEGSPKSSGAVDAEHSPPVSDAEAHAEGDDHPRNVIVILTDDQPRRTLAAMPQLQSQLVAKGMTFTNAVVSNPLCCPSRATFLTGRYAHETGVWDNSPRYGGWAHFLPWESRTVAVQLHDAGYTTAFLGKYLNGYGLESDAPVPPGWDRWFAFVPSSPPNYYDYTLNVDGTLVHHGHQPEDYSTDVLAEEAERFVLATDGPFFLVISTYAPHQPFEPAPRYAKRAVTFEPGVAYNEPNMRDKPAWARSLRRVNAADQAVAQTRALLAVDDLVGRVARALTESDELDDTAVIYTSDNGLAWGDHRWLWKSAPWEESIGVPFVVRADGLVQRGRSDYLVANTDIAPTIAALAGLPPPETDGRSLVPLLKGEKPRRWRSYVTLESMRYRASRIPLAQLPSYCGLRARALTYVQYATGEEELYDLRADPWQLQSLVADQAQAGRIRRLRREALGRCKPLPPLPAGWRLLRPVDEIPGPAGGRP